MTFKKKNLLMVLLLLLVCLLTSCSTARSSRLKEWMNEESEKIEQMSKDIIRCFTERDKEGLKEIFCEQIRSQTNFENEIDEAFEFLKCDVYTTSERDTSASGDRSWDSGKCTKWSLCPDIPYIAVLCDSEVESEDMERRYYSINYHWVIVNEKDKSLEGIQYMNIELLNVDSIEIGDNELI